VSVVEYEFESNEDGNNEFQSRSSWCSLLWLLLSLSLSLPLSLLSLLLSPLLWQSPFPSTSKREEDILEGGDGAVAAVDTTNSLIPPSLAPLGNWKSEAGIIFAWTRVFMVTFSTRLDCLSIDLFMVMIVMMTTTTMMMMVCIV